MKIALIDSGIDAARYPELVLEHDLILEEDGWIRPRRPEDRICTDHGTTCARIIHKYAPSATFCSLEIFHDEEMTGNVTQLLAALNWCYENKIALIHLSAGSMRPSDYRYLRNVVVKLLEEGQFIVAARSNKAQRYTMPACLLGVFGVERSDALSGAECREEASPEPDGVWLKASARHELRDPNGLPYETAQVNSYAAPAVTARLHELLEAQVHPRHAFLPLYWALTECPGAPVPLGMRPDFASDALVFDPARALRGRELLSLRIKDYFTAQTGFFTAIRRDPYAPLLIFPPEEGADDLFWTEVLARSGMRTGIAVAGTAPNWVKRVPPCLIWDERDRDALVSKLPASGSELNTPVIQVKPWGWPTFQVLCRLKAFLERKGFECVALSDRPKSYLYGVECVPPGKPADALAAHFERDWKPDVLVCMVKGGLAKSAPVLTVSLAANARASYDRVRSRVVLPSPPTEEDLERLLSWIS